MPWFEGSCKSLSQGKPLEFAKLEVPGLPCQATNLRLMTVEKFSEDLVVPSSTWTYLGEDFLGRVEEPTPNHTFYNAHSCFGSLFSSQMSENLFFWCLHSPLDHDFWLEALLSRPTAKKKPTCYPEGENSSSIYVRSFLSCILHSYVSIFMFDFPPRWIILLSSSIVHPHQNDSEKWKKCSSTSQCNAIVSSKESVFWRQVPKKDNSQKNREMGARKIKTQKNKMDLESRRLPKEEKTREGPREREREDKWKKTANKMPAKRIKKESNSGKNMTTKKDSKTM